MYFGAVSNSTYWLDETESTDRLIPSITTLVTKGFLKEPDKVLVSAEEVQVVVKLH